MPLTLILGPAAGGKTTQLEQEILQIAQRDAQQPVIYIVPEQTTLKVQQRLLARMPGRSLLGVEILSFNRLAHRVFAETGVPSVRLLDDMGKCMVLYKLAQDHQEELVYYGSSVRQKGFIGQLKLMVTEIYQYGLDEEALLKLISQQPEDSILRAKLTDIALLWRYFQEYTGQQAIASEAVLDLLAERITQSALLRSAYVFVDDFSGFTPQQYRILTGLALHSRKLTAALTLTPETWRAVQSVQDWRELPGQLFFTPGKTAWKLQHMAQEYRIPLQICWMQQDRRSPELIHINRELCQPVPKPYGAEQQRIQGCAAAHQTEELQQVFHEIWRLVRDEGYSFRDIAIVAADLDSYAHGLRRQMMLYGIPGFVDEKMDITLNPYVQWLQSLGELPRGGYRSETLFALLKTGLMQITLEETDLLENMAIRENWWGKERLLDGLRQNMADPQLAEDLEHFLEQTKGQHTVRQLTEAYQALADSQKIAQRLTARSQELAQQGHLQKAMEYERIFQVISELQQQYIDIMGSVTMDLSEYAEVLEVGISQCKMGQLPPSLDELLAADLGRSKLTSCRAVFFVGLQEGSFPKRTKARGLLTQKERETASVGLELAQGEKENLLEQYYLLYSAMGKARERMYFFSSRSGADGEATGESVIWKRLHTILGDTWQMKSRPAEQPLALLYEAKGPVSGAAGKWLENHGYRETLERMRQAEKTRAEERKLSAAAARRLMDPSQRQLSVTQLEQYARCPFAYYLRYGLNLQEREAPQVRALEDGNVLHDILQEAGAFLTQALQEEEAVRLAEQLSGLKQEEYHVYQTCGRYRYFWKKLQKTVARALQILSRQVQMGDFQPKAFEWKFGRGADSGAPVEVTLPDGRTLHLQGKIDRVDLWESETQRYVRVIDYKSGSTEYKPAEMFAGLQLQLPVYLEASEQAFDAQPAGFFYFHLKPQMQEAEEGYHGAAAEFERLLMHSGRLDGVFLEDLSIAGHMDREIASDPLVLKAKVTKDGHFAKNNQTATPEQFAQLRRFTHAKVSELAEGMSSGKVAQKPVQLGQSRACDYCEYRSACPFDLRIPGSQCQTVEKLSASEFWERIEKV